jgi:hypothetical protein
MVWHSPCKDYKSNSEDIMDITGIPQNPTPSSDLFAAGKLATTQPVRKSETVNEAVQIPQVEQIDLYRAEEKRLQAIKKTVERSTTGNAFPVRDNRFTIFKDSISGQYITRFTSLRDGSVTYVPEPDIMRLSGSKSYVQVQA